MLYILENMRTILWITFALMGLAFSGVSCQPPNPGPPSYSKELETELRTNLFEGYEIMQRPQQQVNVFTSLNLLSLNYLDIKEQQLSVTAYFHFLWKDTRLMWFNNDTYNNIRFLFSNEKIIWTPALIVENSVDNIDVISKPAVPMRIDSKGRVEWLPAGIFTTHCESYITYWPLDTQTCEIILSSWGYTGNEVQLMSDLRNLGIVMTFYQEHGEWELLNQTFTSVTTEREQESFSRLVFTFMFRRRPLFHMLNTLFPVVLMGFLTVAIFKLSPESGERVGLALTILLAYAVYLTLISESIPQTSMSASLLSSYLASTLFLQTLAVLLTVIYLDIYFTPEERRVPNWLQVFTQCCLARVACVDCTSSKSKVRPQKSTTTLHNEPSDLTLKKINIKDQAEISNERNSAMEAWADDDIDDVTKEYSWKEIALLLDKVTMYVYLVLVTTLTIVCMAVMLNHYMNAYSLSM